MITLQTKDLDNTATRKLLSGSILPRPIALVSTLQENGKVNMAPFSWFNIVSGFPPMISIAVRNDLKEQKDTPKNIFREKEFVIHIISYNFLEQANKTSDTLGRDESEVEYVNLTIEESTSIKTPGIKEAKIRLECEYEQHLELGTSVLIIGKVKTFHIDDEVYQDGKINLEKLNPVGRLSGKRYSLIGDIISFE